MISQDEFHELTHKPVRSLLDASKYLSISMLINRAHYAIQNSQLRLGQDLLNDAIGIACTLQENTLVMARCFFWYAVIAGNIGQEDRAVDLFIRALPSIGHSQEGDHLPPYLKKYEYNILDLLMIPNAGPQRFEQRENWLRIVETALRQENSLYTEAPTILTASPTSHYFHEDEEAMLRRLVGDDRDHNSRILQHEATAGLKTRPNAAPGFTVSHFLPEHGLVKPLPMGGWKKSTLTLLDRSGTIKDRPRSIPISPGTPSTDGSQQKPIPRPIAVKRMSSTKTSEALKPYPTLRSLSKKLLSPIDTQKPDHSSEPEIPSPLREAFLPGEDTTLGNNMDETY